MRGRLAALALLSLGLLCWFLAREAAVQLERGGEVDSLVLSAAVDEARHDEMRELEEAFADPVRFALWTERAAQWVETPVLGRGLSLAVLPVWGDTRLLLPAAGGLGERDAAGCLIDTHSARSLFGSAEPVGASLLWGERELTVRGVFDGPRGTLLVRPDAGAALDRVSLTGGERAVFAMRHGLSVSARVSGSVLGEVARLLWLSPLLMAATLLFGRAAGLVRESYGFPVKTALWGAVVFAAFTGGLLLLLRLLPSPLIPSRWSDFEGWRSTLSTAWEQTSGWLGAAWCRPDRRLLRLLAHSALGAVGAHCLLLAARCLRWPPQGVPPQVRVEE